MYNDLIIKEKFKNMKIDSTKSRNIPYKQWLRLEIEIFLINSGYDSRDSFCLTKL